MKCVQVTLVLFILVKTDLCYAKSQALHHVNKQEDAPWVWERIRKLSNSNDKVNSRQADTTTILPEENPCTPFERKKPDFSSGRRISQSKCYDYIWELKNRDDVRKKNSACFEYMVRKLKKRNQNRSYPGIGGRDTLPGEFPHMGAVGWRGVAGNWLFKCGSSLISPKFLLTAAHCSRISSADRTVVDTRPEIVRLRDKNIIDIFANGQDPLDVNILRFIVHPQYAPPRKYFDIGLIELVNDVMFDKYLQPACLWTEADTTPLGTKASLTGWGYVDSARLRTSPELQAVFVDVIDSNLCNNLLRPAFNRHFNGVESNQICAGVLAGGVDSCQGDSGGPLQVKIPLPITSEGSMSYLIGVTSFGFGCARANTPGVYTRVSSFIDWIESIVWP